MSRRGGRGWLLRVSVSAAFLLAVLARADPAAPKDRVYPDAESVEPLSVGARVPSVEVRTPLGAPVDLATLVADRGALLVFYRGGW